MYEITVTTVFAAAHAIRLPDDSLEPVHGHNWSVALTVGSETLDAIETVMDFHPLEASLKQAVEPWVNGDLNRCSPFVNETGELVINPTAERVAWAIAQAVNPQLPESVKLLSVTVGEAPGCTATYRPNLS